MPYVPVPKDLTKVKTKPGLQSDEAPAYLFQPCRACRPSGVFLYPRGDRELGGCTFDDRADDALFLLRHV